MKLSILIPVHNEQATIEQVLKKVAEVNLGEWKKEIIVVNDGSDDETKNILENLRQTHNFSLINHLKNLGKGAAIITGISEASGDYVVIQDADLEYDPSEIPKLIAGLGENHQIVFGARGIQRYPERGLHYVVGAKILTWTVNLLFFSKLSDLYTGYKLMPLNIIKQLNLEATGFEFEAEVTCKILKAGNAIKEVSISYTPRSKAQGKHIGFLDALVGFWTILKFRVK